MVAKNDHVARPVLQELDGNSFEFHPLNVSDITGPLTDYMQMLETKKVMAQRDALDPETFEYLLNEAKAKASKIKYGATEWSEAIQTLPVLAYTFWLSLRKGDKGVKLADFEQMLINDEEGFQALADNTLRIMGMPEEEAVEDTKNSKEETTGPKKERSKKSTAKS